jgi:uncharacterized phage protein (TIGR01671 family)
MREIKFRALKKNSNEIVYFDLKEFLENDIEEMPNAMQYVLKNLMQYTGLKDKNGKEIYEGDILNFGNKNNVEVIFDNGCFNVFDEPLGWDFTPDYDNDYKPIKTNFKYCEVIGNIHENPELL